MLQNVIDLSIFIISFSFMHFACSIEELGPTFVQQHVMCDCLEVCNPSMWMCNGPRCTDGLNKPWVKC